jgi:hypothetical protein
MSPVPLFEYYGIPVTGTVDEHDNDNDDLVYEAIDGQDEPLETKH